MNLPRPGAPHIDNLIATMLIAGNSSAKLKDNGLDLIARHQGFDPAHFRSRFAQLETQWSLQPTNSGEEFDGK